MKPFLFFLLLASLPSCGENEHLDPSDYSKECTDNSDCGAFTTQCITEDCICPNFSAALSEGDAIDEDRQNLSCLGLAQGIECECQVTEATCVDGSCTLQRE